MTELLPDLFELYGPEAGATDERLQVLLQNYRLKLEDYLAARGVEHGRSLDPADAILITYGDQVWGPDASPLRELADFCRQHISGVISAIHILPFYPYSSDDGFSVIDYRQVDPDLGEWQDIAHLGAAFRLMFDLVINHISAQSDWFQAFLKDEQPFQDYFITVEDGTDLTQVVRPRALPLLTRFDTPSGPKAVWTTFSADQIDLNYQNPEVLLQMIDVVLDYVSRGAEFIRLDAIAYLWKEPGTSCIHLPQTHRVVQIIRQVLDQAAPWVRLITETNVPHAENLSYFGDGKNEAQLVYNFSLPPLVLHTLHTGDCQALAGWVDRLTLPCDQTTFFNFLASHDGVGLNPARGIIAEAAIGAMVEKVLAHGGLVSYKANPDGTQSPYELNINYFDALSDPNSSEPLAMRVERFVAAHAIMLSLVGVPGIYFHSLFGSSGWPEGVAQTGRNRTINRQKLSRQQLEAELAQPSSQRAMVFGQLAHLLRVRAAHPAFHPHGAQRSLQASGQVFALLRFTSGRRAAAALCLVNVTAQSASVRLEMADLPFDSAQPLVDLLSGDRFFPEGTLSIQLRPYQVCWLANP